MIPELAPGYPCYRWPRCEYDAAIKDNLLLRTVGAAPSVDFDSASRDEWKGKKTARHKAFRYYFDFYKKTSYVDEASFQVYPWHGIVMLEIF